MIIKLIAAALSLSILFAIGKNLIDARKTTNEQFLSKLELAVNAQVSKTENEDFKMELATVKKNELIHNVTMKNIGPGETSAEDVREAVYPDLVEAACSGLFEPAFDRGITMSYLYQDNQKNEVLYLPFTKRTCPKT